MKLKRLVVLLLVLALMLTVSACGSKEQTPTDTAGTDQTGDNDNSILEPDSKDIKAWLWAGHDVHVNKFLQDNPEFTVDTSEETVGVFGDRSVDLPKLASSIAAREQPDLFLGWMTPSEGYYTDMFMPETEFLNKDPNYNIKDIDEGVFDATTFNNEIYFVPCDYTAGILVWNKDLFEEVGLDPNTPPKTWDELKEIASKLSTSTTSGALKNIGFEQSGFHWETFHLSSFGTGYVDKTGLNWNWDTPEFLKTFEFIKSLEDTYGGNEKLGSGQYIFIFGNVGMSGWNGSALASLNTIVNFEVGSSPMPAVDENSESFVPAAVGAWLGIPKTANNPGGAWKLITSMMTDGMIEDSMRVFNEDPNEFMPGYINHKPTREKVYDLFGSLLSEDLMNAMKARDELEAKANVPLFTSPVQTNVMNLFKERYTEMIKHDITPQDMLKQLQEFSDSEVKSFIERKEGEGWVFDENGVGIPPASEE